ncbi:hypothetical protein ACFST9_02145 [Hymenobacter monticola]|uniref:Uncharacterized protein n=1 Tax=Hymenobacter monticola TaxID=1705399 RepID=A0ABY4B289_9BACT|nr:hypothetical protein [Hymenobacter monticola]UOE33237.1 hypothetical protein MTP16_19185 [Hymenobacter monticola]
MLTKFIMPLKLHRFLQALAALVFLFCGLGIANTMVSLKYERKDNNCISVVDGRNLCQALHYNWIGLGTAVAFIAGLAFVKINIDKPAE